MTWDESAAAEPLAGYFEGLERRDPVKLRAVFAADASGTWGPAGEIGLHGIDEIVAHLIGSLDGISVTFVPRPPRLVIRGQVATADSGAVAFLTVGDQLIIACAHYSDRLRQEDGRWLIERRDHVERWRATVPLTMRDGRRLRP